MISAVHCDLEARRRLLPGAGAGLLGLLILTQALVAVAAPEPLGDPAGQAAPGQIVLGAELGFESLLGEQFVAGLLGASLRQKGGLVLSLAAPLRYDPVGARLRPGDWDEPADLGRLLRRFEAGQPGGPFSLRLGEPSSVTLGHGTLVQRYYGLPHPDRRPLALQLAGHGSTLAGEAFVADLLRPGLFAARGAWSPGARGQGASRGLSFGLSVAADVGAPFRLAAVCSASEAATGPCAAPRRLALDEQGWLQVAERATLALGALDLGWRIPLGPQAAVLPYTALGADLDGGWGLHLGVSLEWRVRRGLDLAARLEGREAAGGYRPGLFGTIYEWQRWGLQGAPLAARIADLPAGHGVYGELGARVGSALALALLYEEQELDGQGGVLSVRAETKVSERVQGALLWRRAGLRAARDLPQAAAQLWVAEVRLRVFAALYLSAYGAQTWAVAADPREDAPFEQSLAVGCALGGALRWPL